jgi:hypothetical protein
MILNGPKLLIHPRSAWASAVGDRSRSAVWLVVAALTAAVLPAAAVVAGHLGSAIFGWADHATATLRAAIGFMSVAGGVLVVAPAFSLILMSLTRWSRGEATPGRAVAVAMGIVWPAWTAGSVLAVPPLFGLGPEIGELLWLILVAIVSVRTVRAGGLAALAIRRRWAGHFVLRVTVAFVLLFTAVTITPAMAVRAMLGAATEILPALPERPALPLPPAPNW